MGGPIADERRAANKKRLLHISLGFIVGLLVGGIGVGWLSQWPTARTGATWAGRCSGARDVRGARRSEVRYVEQCPVCPKTPEPEVRTVEKRETDCPPAIECRCDAPIAEATSAAIGCPVCDPCPVGGAEQGRARREARSRSRSWSRGPGKRPRSRWKPVSRLRRPRRLTMPHPRPPSTDLSRPRLARRRRRRRRR